MLVWRSVNVGINRCISCRVPTVGSKKLEHGGRMISAVVPAFVGVGFEDRHVPTF